MDHQSFRLPKITADTRILNKKPASLHFEFDSCLKVIFLKQAEIVKELEYAVFEKVNPNKAARRDDLKSIKILQTEKGLLIPMARVLADKPS